MPSDATPPSAAPPPPRPQQLGEERLAELLLRTGLLSEEQLRIARHEQQQRPQPLGETLIALGFISAAALRDSLAAASGHPGVSVAAMLIDPAVLALVPHPLARRHRLLPLALQSNHEEIVVAIADASDIVALDRLRAVLDPALRISLRIAASAELERAIEHHYGNTRPAEALLADLESAARGLAAGQQNQHSSHGQALVKVVDALIAEAVGRGASDLHFEPEAAFLRIRERIDGTLRQTRVIHKSFCPELAVRLKVIAGLDIAETRLPQDGRMSLALGGRTIDFRVATQPTLHGENIVLRILDRDKGIVPLSALELSPAQQQALDRMLARPEGLILVTGPTGSGKTTTLYSILQHLNREQVNIMTLEDPVEYPLAQIRQSMVGEHSRLGFADGVRALLRQDPDIILIGEIRDADTAHMALRAALTGHRVFATLHANSALGALPRLLDIGLRADLLAGNLSGILAQRLVRRLCLHCRQPAVPTASEQALLAFHHCQATQVHQSKGCQACNFSGYHGRLALLELLAFDEELDTLLGSGASLPELRRQVQRTGHQSLAAAGLARIAAGLSSFAEVARVVDLGATVRPDRSEGEAS